MGFYLPGIGEAIGGGLRMQRQNEMWEKAQTILKDETKPMSERMILVSSAYPELSNTPEWKDKMDTARQYDADKMARAKFEREEAARKSVDTFKGVLAELDPEARLRVMKDNPDKAAIAFPEEWGLIKDADKAAADREEMLMLENGRNARSAASINARREAAQATLAATAAKPIPETPEQRQARELETARLKAEQAASLDKAALAEKRTQVDANIEAGIDAVISDIDAEGGVGWSGADYGKREALRKTLGLALAQRENPGRPPTDADVAVAMERVPDMTTFVSAEEAKAALKTLKQTFRGFAPAGFVIE